MLEVLRDDLHLEALVPGAELVSTSACEGVLRLAAFVKAVVERGAAFGWDVLVARGESPTALYVSGICLDERVLVLGSTSVDELAETRRELVGQSMRADRLQALDERRARFAAAVERAAEAVAAWGTSTNILALMLEAVLLGTPAATRGLVAFGAPDDACLRVRAVLGFSAPVLLGMPLPVWRGAVADALSGATAVVLTEVGRAFPGLPDVAAAGSAAVVPLPLSAERRGFLALFAETADAFEEDVPLLSSVGISVLLALRNIELSARVAELSAVHLPT